MLDAKPGFEWRIRDDGIIVYSFADSRRVTIDKFAETLRQHRDAHYAASKAIKRIWYFADGMMPTPYAVKITMQLAREMPATMRSQIACVLANKRVYTLIRYAFSRIDARKDYIRFFNDEASALDWLLTTESPITPT